MILFDEAHSNAHSVWEGLGCPDWPSDQEIAAMRARERLELAQLERCCRAEADGLAVALELPVHAVSLLEIEADG